MRIQSIQCECPAGKDTHGTCKHLSAVLFVILKLISNDCVLEIRKSFTENLQTLIGQHLHLQVYKHWKVCMPSMYGINMGSVYIIYVWYDIWVFIHVPFITSFIHIITFVLCNDIDHIFLPPNLFVACTKVNVINTNLSHIFVTRWT